MYLLYKLKMINAQQRISVVVVFFLRACELFKRQRLNLAYVEVEELTVVTTCYFNLCCRISDQVVRCCYIHC